jgi:hypothetical protein
MNAESPNVAAVRRWLGAAADADAICRRVEELFDEQADYYPVAKIPEAAPAHGLEEIEAFMRAWFTSWDQWRLELRWIEELPGERVIARADATAVSLTGVPDLRAEFHFVFWLRHGRFLRVEDHLSERGARRALGLEEPDV